MNDHELLDLLKDNYPGIGDILSKLLHLKRAVQSEGLDETFKVRLAGFEIKSVSYDPKFVGKA